MITMKIIVLVIIIQKVSQLLHPREVPMLIRAKKCLWGTHGPVDDQGGPGVLQIECIATLWLRNEAATPTTPSAAEIEPFW